MIGRIRGEVIDVEPQSIVVDVQGVGYLIHVALGGAYVVGDNVDIFVQTHVREDALMLYGFRTKQEREVFNHLTSVPNIGPSKAIAIVGTPIDELVQLVVTGDILEWDRCSTLESRLLLSSSPKRATPVNVPRKRATSVPACFQSCLQIWREA